MSSTRFAAYQHEIQVKDVEEDQIIQLSVYKEPLSGVLFCVDDDYVQNGEVPDPYSVDVKERLTLWPSKCIPFMIEWLADHRDYKFVNLRETAESFDLSTELRLDSVELVGKESDYEEWAVELGEYDIEIDPSHLKDARDAWLHSELESSRDNIRVGGH